MGSYDIVEVIEAPDDESITRLALAVALAGNVRTTTLRAFSEKEFEKIVRSLP